MAEPIQIKRRLGGMPGPPGTLEPGELAFNDNGDTLYIGTALSTDVRTLVSTGRFLPIAGGTLTGPLALGTAVTPVAGLNVHGAIAIHGAGGTLNYESETDPGNANSVWSMWADGATTTSATIFSMTPPAAPITGTDAARLTIHANGNVDVANLLTAANPPLTVFTAKDVNGALIELHDQIATLAAGATRVGGYNASTNLVEGPVKPLTVTAGLNLPVAQMAMQGWYVTVSVPGVGGPNISGGPLLNMAAGDWIQCDGTQWSLIPMGLGAIGAGSVSFNPVASPAIAGTNVQTAIEQLNTAAMRAVVSDATQFSGNGTTGSALTIIRIDGGTY